MNELEMRIIELHNTTMHDNSVGGPLSPVISGRQSDEGSSGDLINNRSGPCPRMRSHAASKSDTTSSSEPNLGKMTGREGRATGGKERDQQQQQQQVTSLPPMQPYDRRMKLPPIPEYGGQPNNGTSSSGSKRRRNTGASHKGTGSGGRSRQRRKTLATSTLAFCAALVGVINLGSGGGHSQGGSGLLLRGSRNSPDLVGSGANPLSRGDVRRILAAIGDSDGDSIADTGGDRRSLSSTAAGTAAPADGEHRTLAGINDERLLQAFSPDEYRLLQAATETAEYKENPVGVMTMLLQHFKQAEGVGTLGGTNTSNRGDSPEGTSTTAGQDTVEGDGIDDNKGEDNGDDKDGDKTEYSDRMMEVIDHLYKKATEYELLKKNGVPNPPPVPAYLELFEHYNWKFDGLISTLLKAQDSELLKKTRELRYPDKFTCTDIDEETGKPIKKIRKPGEADECYMKLMPLVEIVDDDPDEKERRSIMDRFNMVHSAVKERMDDDRREEMKRRAEEMRESEKRRQEREDKEKMDKEAREREEARKAQGW